MTTPRITRTVAFSTLSAYLGVVLLAAVALDYLGLWAIPHPPHAVVIAVLHFVAAASVAVLIIPAEDIDDEQLHC